MGGLFVVPEAAAFATGPMPRAGAGPEMVRILGRWGGALPSTPASGAAVPATRPRPQRPGPVWRHAGDMHRPRRPRGPSGLRSPRRHLGLPSALTVKCHRSGGPAPRGKRRPAASPAEPRPAVCRGQAGRDAGPSDPPGRPDGPATALRAIAVTQRGRPPPGAQDGRGRGCDAGVRAREWRSECVPSGPRPSPSAWRPCPGAAQWMRRRIVRSVCEPVGRGHHSPRVARRPYRVDPARRDQDRATNPEGRCVPCARRPVSPVPSPA